MRILFFIQFILAAGLLCVHVVALQYDLYWHYLWLDVPMHFFGGAWAALFCMWALRFFRGHSPFLAVLAGVIAVGIGWELLEFAIGFQREANFAFDTALDLLMDVLGGISAFILAEKFFARGTIIVHGTAENDPS